MESLLTWVKRATGIGYQSFPAIEDTDEALQLRQNLHRADQVVVQIEQLERELRRRGQLRPHRH